MNSQHYLTDADDSMYNYNSLHPDEAVYLLSREKENFVYLNKSDEKIKEKNSLQNNYELGYMAKLDQLPHELILSIVVNILRLAELECIQTKKANASLINSPFKITQFSDYEKREISAKALKLTYNSLLNLRGVNKKLYNFFTEVPVKDIKELSKKTAEDAHLDGTHSPIQKAYYYGAFFCFLLSVATLFSGISLAMAKKEAVEVLTILTSVLGGFSGLLCLICCIAACLPHTHHKSSLVNRNNLSIQIKTYLEDFSLFAKKNNRVDNDELIIPVAPMPNTPHV